MQTVEIGKHCVIITDNNGQKIWLECNPGDEYELAQLIADNSKAEYLRD